MLTTLLRSSVPSATTSIPVLIAGGGPVGLFQAYLLTKLGVSVRIVERELAISPLSKALSIHPRTLEIFNFCGIIDEFSARGKVLKESNIYFGNRRVATMPVLSLRKTHYSRALFLEQAKTSGLFVQELSKLGVEVERGWELLDAKVVEDSNDKSRTYVESILRKPISGSRADRPAILGEVELLEEDSDCEYEIQTVRSDYLIAADGGRSTVRHKLNIPFPGITRNNKTFIWDGTFESDISMLGVSNITGTNKKNMRCIPLSDGLYRVAIDAGVFEAGEDMEGILKDLTVEKFEKLASDCIAPSRFKIKETAWLTCFKVNERRAEHFNHKNRIFLAGDAAHIQSPSGGQGLNIGLQDAHNLAWKIALVLNKVAPESVLGTYDEREAIADRAIALSSKLFTESREEGTIAFMKRRAYYLIVPSVLKFLIHIGFAPENSRALLEVKYKKNTLNRDSATSSVHSSAFEVGIRAPDGLVRTVPGAQEKAKELRLHDITTGIGRFHILVFVSDMLASSSTTVIPGISTTNLKELEHNIDDFVPRWRGKWSYASPISDGHSDNDIFKVNVIAAKLGPYVTSSAFINRSVGNGKIFIDDSKSVHSSYNFSCTNGHGGIVVVRPDSQVSFRVEGTGERAWKAADHYFASILSAVSS
ncbi:hypothetical protein BGZ96_007058 [Linnemannia gamsii]|uniref:FAD-binding domain-containing protein n=1 Tax=Linnemannia gamsii TaxID=64522 RepID=A0ABQ7K3K5_9FUNG|nr:hypothetical protein BGZ96_007058 [Linnemannia gamsii]